MTTSVMLDLLFIISLSGPIAIAILTLRTSASRRLRMMLAMLAIVALAAFYASNYLCTANLPPSGPDSDIGPQDAWSMAFDGTILAVVLDVIVIAVLLPFRSLILRSRRRKAIRMSSAERPEP